MKAIVVLVTLLAAPAAAGPFRSVRPTVLNGICAVQDTGTIVCEKANSLPPIDILARDLVPAYHPVIVRPDGTVVRVKQKLFDDDKVKPEVIAVPFKVKTAGLVDSAKAHALCVYGEKGELACGPFDVNGDTKIAFTTLAGRFVDVAFIEDVLWALDDRGALWCRGPSHCARAQVAAKKAPKKALLDLSATWPSPIDAMTDAPFAKITDGVKHLYAGGTPCIERTSDAKTLVCWSSSAPVAYARPKGEEIASMGALTCARTKDSIECVIFGNQFSKPFTLKVENAAKMHFGDVWFCVETTKAELRCARFGNPMPALDVVQWAERPPPKRY